MVRRIFSLGVLSADWPRSCLLAAMCAAAAISPAQSGRAIAESTTKADVVVYGATPAGVCAAVGAAREGARVLLVEPTNHIGGVNTGGLCFSDSNQMWRAALGGLFEEFHRRIEQDYQQRGIKLPYAVGVKDQVPWTYEPHVAARVVDALLREAGVAVVTKQALKSVVMQGRRIVQIVTAERNSFAGRTFIDATYEGDLLAAAGVASTWGREGRGEFNESLAGKQYPKKPMPFSGLDDRGALLPLITARDAGPDALGDRNVMVYSFRLCVTANPANRVPFPAPAHYDPARFEALRRYLAVGKPELPWDLYPLPGDKADANNGIGKQFSMGLVGSANEWCGADAAGRQRIWEEHKQYTLELYHFFTTDPAVPAAMRDEVAKYGLCRDEFAAYDHWSPQLYVREGRRMRGEYVLTQADILSTNAKPDPIALASFPIDSHDCQRIARGTSEVVNEGTIFPYRLDKTQRAGPPYQVPYRAITPRATECENLLVPVALSATHVAYSSIRVEPTWMTIGHSAGIAAALAATGNRPVQQLDYTALRGRLVAQRQKLDFPAGYKRPEMDATR
ncbi:MAG TPA: FAD-dependent oxidoreductase [Pirellulales bacterium]|nr:FAD-dependent oxidoreductase [Pirellulales bacterium]